jgi:hypothetical protein
MPGSKGVSGGRGKGQGDKIGGEGKWGEMAQTYVHMNKRKKRII